MPTKGFSRGFLNGVASGGSKLFQAILGADKAYQNGMQQEELRQSRIAQATGAAAENEAQAANWKAKTAVLNGRPGLYEEQTAIQSGYDVPTVQAYRKSVAGAPPQVPMGPPTEDGGYGTGSFKVEPEMHTRIGQALRQLLPLVANSGDLNPAQLADADATYSTLDLQNQVLGGQRTPNAVSDAVAAAMGKYQQGGGTAKAPSGFQWAPEQPGRLQPIPGGPKDQSAFPPKDGKGAKAPFDQERAEILFKELIDVRSDMNSLQGDDLARAQADEAALVAELRSIGVKDSGQLAMPKVSATQVAKKPPTEGQAKALMFGTRMAIADEILNELMQEKTKYSGFIKGTAQGVAGAVPIVGDSLRQAAGTATNWTQSANQQKVEQAKRDFINAVLRRESGAVIGQDEFENADQQYFPQRGDSDAVIKQKAANRRTAIEGFKAEFGEPLMPDFLRTVRGARGERQKTTKGQSRPGAQTGVYTAPAAEVQRTVTVDY